MSTFAFYDKEKYYDYCMAIDDCYNMSVKFIEDLANEKVRNILQLCEINDDGFPFSFANDTQVSLTYDNGCGDEETCLLEKIWIKKDDLMFKAINGYVGNLLEKCKKEEIISLAFTLNSIPKGCF